MNINLELYKVFYCVARNESITRAANELLISQPAISKSIKTLEDQIGTQLFIRKRDGVILTEAGETIYIKIKEAMDLIDSAENDLQVLTNMEKGIINIGASKTIIHEYLMPHIKSFHKKYPKIKIRIFTDKPSDLVEKLKIGLIDMIFMNFPYKMPADLKIIKLMTLHDCLVASESYNYLKERRITNKDLETLPLLLLTKGTSTRIRLDDYCSENNINIKPEMEFGSNSLIKEFTSAGFGIGMLTEEHVKEELKSGNFFKLNFNFPLKEKYLGLVYNLENKSLASKNFIDHIKRSIE